MLIPSDSSNSFKDSLPWYLDYPQIVTVPASPTLDEDEPEETLDTRAGPIDRDTGNIEQLTNPGQPSPTTVQLVWANSPVVSRHRNIGDTGRPEYTDRIELDCLANTSGAAPCSTEDSIQESDLVNGLEKLE